MGESRRPGRPAKPGREDDLLEAALEAFFRHGYAATRMEDVAARAGVSKGAIYLYFANKPALFQAVVRRFLAPTVDRLEALAADATTTAPEQLERQIDLLYTEIVTTRLARVLRLIVAEGDRFPDLVAFYFERIVARMVTALARTVEHGIATGAFRADSAVRAQPQLLAAPALMAALWRLLFEAQQPLEVEAYRRAHLAFCLDALRAARPAT